MSSKDVGRRFGLTDPDLTTPGHDALLLWADEHWLDIARRVHGSSLLESLPDDRPRIWEKPITNGSYIVGYWDLFLDFGSSMSIGVELKTAIPSLGELVRQLRTYERYEHSVERGGIVVVCPDARFAKQIESQGFFFIEPIGSRTDVLLRKAEEGGLTSAEKVELHGLLIERRRAP